MINWSNIFIPDQASTDHTWACRPQRGGWSSPRLTRFARSPLEIINYIENKPMISTSDTLTSWNKCVSLISHTLRIIMDFNWHICLDILLNYIGLILEEDVGQIYIAAIQFWWNQFWTNQAIFDLTQSRSQYHQVRWILHLWKISNVSLSWIL